MKHPALQLMVRGESVAQLEPELDCPGVTHLETRRVDSPNYLFIDLELAPNLAPGSCDIRLRSDNGHESRLAYRFEARRPGSADRKGFSSADVIYLIMPDRFANGDSANDSVPGMVERATAPTPTAATAAISGA